MSNKTKVVLFIGLKFFRNLNEALAGKTQLLRCTTFVASRSTYLVLARLASSRATTDCYVLYVMNKSHKWPQRSKSYVIDHWHHISNTLAGV